MKIIVTEGPRGVGKTTIVQGLKNHTKECMVMQLSGIKKVEDEREQIFKHYNNLHEFFRKDKDIPYTLFLDRTFITEAVYCNLGFKNYLFDEEFDKLLKEFADTGIEIHFVLLNTNPDNYEERLKRDKVQFQNLTYNKEDSLKESEAFKYYFEKIKTFAAINECFNVYTHEVSNDTEDPLDAVKEIMYWTGLEYNS